VSRRTLRLLAVSYAIKTLLVGLAWLAVPDLPERATSTARSAWEGIVGPGAASR
jgi:hypothetical protein